MALKWVKSDGVDVFETSCGDFNISVGQLNSGEWDVLVTIADGGWYVSRSCKTLEDAKLIAERRMRDIVSNILSDLKED